MRLRRSELSTPASNERMIAKAAASTADLVFLDLQMPGGSGLEVLRAIRPDHPALQILVCTNYAYPRYREECLSAGANYFLDKSAELSRK